MADSLFHLGGVGYKGSQLTLLCGSPKDITFSCTERELLSRPRIVCMLLHDSKQVPRSSVGELTRRGGWRRRGTEERRDIMPLRFLLSTSRHCGRPAYYLFKPLLLRHVPFSFPSPSWLGGCDPPSRRCSRQQELAACSEEK